MHVRPHVRTHVRTHVHARVYTHPNEVAVLLWDYHCADAVQLRLSAASTAMMTLCTHAYMRAWERACVAAWAHGRMGAYVHAWEDV